MSGQWQKTDIVPCGAYCLAGNRDEHQGIALHCGDGSNEGAQSVVGRAPSLTWLGGQDGRGQTKKNEQELIRQSVDL